MPAITPFATAERTSGEVSNVPTTGIGLPQSPAVSCFHAYAGCLICSRDLAGSIGHQSSSLRISFHGADRNVTGSCHLVECAGHRILVDCGLYQGGRELHEENAEPFGFDPAEIDCVLLTHAHLDHCGRLPLLLKRGFRGEIITTAPSRDLTRLVLLDTAHLQEEEADYRAHRAHRRGEFRKAEPLYSVADAVDTMALFRRTVRYGDAISLTPNITAMFFNAGHILGSASIFLQLEEADRRCTVLLSGDIGNVGRPLLRAPDPPPRSDAVVMETTYGDRLHRSIGESVDELNAAINDGLWRGGNVIIPTFALERGQELLYYLNKGAKAGILPTSMQVYLDSPMAISAIEVFRHHPEDCAPDITNLLRNGHDPFRVPNLRLVRSAAESKQLNSIRSGAVILAGSGMCAGGRVRHHLLHNLWREEASVIFVGYAASGTLARQIIDGVKQVRIFDEDVPVRAKIHTINGFSAHADQQELLAWHQQTSAKRTFLVHGEEKVMRLFAAALVNTEICMPVPQESFDL